MHVGVWIILVVLPLLVRVDISWVVCVYVVYMVCVCVCVCARMCVFLPIASIKSLYPFGHLIFLGPNFLDVFLFILGRRTFRFHLFV